LHYDDGGGKTKGEDMEYIKETLEKRKKKIEKAIKYHKDRITVLEAEYDKITKVLENFSIY